MPDFIYFIPFLFLLDIWGLWYAKEVLIQFLTGTVNRKKWRTFHRKQNLMDRLTLNYIEPLIKKHLNKFRFLHRVYEIMLYSIPAKYLLLILGSFFLNDKEQWILFITLFVVWQIGDAVFRLQCDSCHQLKCVQKKKRP